MTTKYFEGFSLSSSTTFDAQEFARLVKSIAQTGLDTVVFSVINRDYVGIGRLWAAHMDKLRYQNVVYVCADRYIQDVLQRDGRTTILVEPRRVVLDAGTKSRPDSTFSSDIAIYAVSLKFHVAREFVAAGLNAIYSDVDALWLGDPGGYLGTFREDVLFQCGSFPEDVKAQWGFSACTGFVYLRSNDRVLGFLERVNQRFDGSDQRAFNMALLEDYQVHWDAAPPANWEHGRLSDGWVQPVKGACAATRLSVVGLPHALFQRHGVTVETLSHALVCHPNSPKTDEGKLLVFRGLGLCKN